MNFFDYASLLTVGRGGRFEDRDGGLLSYVASGDEPVLHVGSSRGTPYRAKGLFGSMTPVFAPRYLTREVVDRLATRYWHDRLRGIKRIGVRLEGVQHTAPDVR